MTWDQEILRVLRDAPGQRRVLLTRQGDRLLTTRFFLHPMKLALGGLVEQVTVTGEGSIGGLPETLSLALEGYRVRATLGALAGLPSVVAAGVVSEVGAGLPEPGPGLGYAYVSTDFIAGESLNQIGDRLQVGEKLELLRRLLRLIARLHDQHVVYGDLKPHNVIAVGEEAWLVDLDTMRRVPGPNLAIPTRDLTVAYAAPEQTREQLTYLASDVYSFGRLGNWLLGPELGAAGDDPVLSFWHGLFARALTEDPHERPEARALADAAGISGDGVQDDPAATVPVLDVLAAGDDDETVRDDALAFASPAGLRAGSLAGGAASGGAQQSVIVGDEPIADDAGHDERREGVHRASSSLPDQAGGGESPKTARAPSVAGQAAPGGEEAGASAGSATFRHRGARGFFVGATVSLAVVIAVMMVMYPLGEGAGGADAAHREMDAAPPPADAGPPPYEHCDDGATRVEIAQLTAADPLPTPSKILSWFSGVSPREVEVYRFRDADRGERVVSFELSTISWPDWQEVAAGERGSELCARLGEELERREVGPRAAEERGDSPASYEFRGGRGDAEDVERIGDLRGVVDGDGYAAMLDWLEPLDVDEPRCRSRGGWLRDLRLEIDCGVTNPREDVSPVRIVATMFPGEREPETSERHVILDPGESKELRFRFDDYDDRVETYCDCSAYTLP